MRQNSHWAARKQATSLHIQFVHKCQWKEKLCKLCNPSQQHLTVTPIEALPTGRGPGSALASELKAATPALKSYSLLFQVLPSLPFNASFTSPGLGPPGVLGLMEAGHSFVHACPRALCAVHGALPCFDIALCSSSKDSNSHSQLEEILSTILLPLASKNFINFFLTKGIFILWSSPKISVCIRHFARLWI